MRIAVTALAVCIATAPAIAQTTGADKAGTRLLAKASASFSPTPLDTQIRSVRERLKPADACGSNDECEFYTEDGVRLTFVDPQQYLVIKTVKTDRFKGRSIKALNIGTARAEAQVLKKVRAFLPGAKIRCLSAAESGEGDGVSACTSQLAKGRIKLLFDRNGQLTEARVHAM